MHWQTFLLNLGDDWVKCGDYYYYTKPVKHGEAAEFLKSVSIPAEWTEALSEKDQKINFTADAVQEKNFTPNFKSDDPWFGTVIEQSVTDAYTVPVTSNNPFSVAYEGGAAGLVKVGDDFFSNWGTLMPGDVVSGKVTISNKYAQSVKIYFRTDTIADDNLLQKLHLKIACDGQTLYDGSMAGEITNKVLLGDFAQGSSKDLTYTLTVPAELDNQYAMNKTKTKWIFTAELPETPNKTVATGDSSLPSAFAGLSISLGAAGIIMLSASTKRRKGNEEN